MYLRIGGFIILGRPEKGKRKVFGGDEALETVLYLFLVFIFSLDRGRRFSYLI